MSKFILDIDIDVPDIWYIDDCNLTEEEKKEATKDYINRLWYYKVYCALIKKCQKIESEGYSKDTYTEKHHILPKCMFPDGTSKKDMNKNNIVRMSARYHIMAHLLLSKIYPDNNKIVFAAYKVITYSSSDKMKSERDKAMLKLSTKTISLARESSRKAISEMISGSKNYMYGKHLSEETKEKLSKSLKGRKMSEESKKKISNSLKGRVFSEETLKRMSIANKKKAKKGYRMSEESKEKLRKSKLGFKHTEETKKKISEKRKGRVITKEVREKISNTLKKLGNRLTDKGRESLSKSAKENAKTRVITEETRKKLSIASKKVMNNPEIRKKISDSNKGEKNKLSKRVIFPDGTIYPCVREAAEQLGIARKTLRNWINNHPERGYKFDNTNNKNKDNS